jgi:hypothetical protein
LTFFFNPLTVEALQELTATLSLHCLEQGNGLVGGGNTNSVDAMTKLRHVDLDTVTKAKLNLVLGRLYSDVGGCAKRPS